MRRELSAGGVHHPRYPLIENRVQAGIMAHAHAEARPVSRAGLTEVSSSSRGKISAEVARLVELGLLAEEGLAESEGGRRSALVGIPRSAGLVVAVDIGATHVGVALTTLGSEILVHRREPSDVRFGPHPVLGRVRAILDELFEEQGAGREDVVAIGVGVPGPVEQASGLLTVPPIMPGWDRFPIRDVFLGEYAAPVFVDNDVNIMALGEHWTHWRDREHFLFIKVGTGIGCGIVASGQIHRGAKGAAGDIGHIRLTGEDALCRCGNVGCLEAVSGGGALARRLSEQGIEANTARDVVRLVRDGNSLATQLVREAGRDLGEVLAGCVNFFNPGVIVIGGDLGQASDQLLAGVREVTVSRSLPLATQELRVVPSQLGDRAGVIGAAIMAIEHALSPDAIARAIRGSAAA
jgi:predicted NBD/HSP70 family sugar kinase